MCHFARGSPTFVGMMLTKSSIIDTGRGHRLALARQDMTALDIGGTSA